MPPARRCCSSSSTSPCDKGASRFPSLPPFALTRMTNHRSLTTQPPHEILSSRARGDAGCAAGASPPRRHPGVLRLKGLAEALRPAARHARVPPRAQKWVLRPHPLQLPAQRVANCTLSAAPKQRAGGQTAHTRQAAHGQALTGNVSPGRCASTRAPPQASAPPPLGPQRCSPRCCRRCGGAAAAATGPGCWARARATRPRRTPAAAALRPCAWTAVRAGPGPGKGRRTPRSRTPRRPPPRLAGAELVGAAWHPRAGPLQAPWISAMLASPGSPAAPPARPASQPVAQTRRRRRFCRRRRRRQNVRDGMRHRRLTPARHRQG